MFSNFNFMVHSQIVGPHKLLMSKLREFCRVKIQSWCIFLFMLCVKLSGVLSPLFLLEVQYKADS